MYRGLKYNGSGCIDLTAYQAIKNVSKNAEINRPSDYNRKHYKNKTKPNKSQGGKNHEKTYKKYRNCIRDSRIMRIFGGNGDRF